MGFIGPKAEVISKVTSYQARYSDPAHDFTIEAELVIGDNHVTVVSRHIAIV
jgi:hypothetical protein